MNEKTGVSNHFRISRLAIILMCLVFTGLAFAGMLWATEEISNGALLKTAKYSLGNLKNESLKQRTVITNNRVKAQQHLQALTTRMSTIQARLTRLDALGDRLVEVAGLPSNEFDFNRMPAIGGPEDGDLGEAYSKPDFLVELDTLLDELTQREEKIAVLEKLIQGDQMRYQSFIAGMPLKTGWKSSNFGRRTDPFTGRLAWHKGQDYAGKHGSDVIAAAGGVVTYAGQMRGYGNLVQINHGGGFETRYGHNSKITVSVGDIVSKADVIAKMGTTGRSTGPHVHFEVLKSGKQVNPASYVRASK